MYLISLITILIVNQLSNIIWNIILCLFMVILIYLNSTIRLFYYIFEYYQRQGIISSIYSNGDTLFDIFDVLYSEIYTFIVIYFICSIVDYKDIRYIYIIVNKNVLPVRTAIY